MNQRWQDGMSPFDGDCIRTDDLLSLDELCGLLGVVVSDLQRHYAGQTLFAFDDWHQHDGYVTERHPTDWGKLAADARSPATLLASRQGDSYVHRSFYTEDLSFLLRYDVPDEECGDKTGFAGTFDLSASSNMVARVAALVPPDLRARMKVESSKSYFDKTYSG